VELEESKGSERYAAFSHRTVEGKPKIGFDWFSLVRSLQPRFPTWTPQQQVVAADSDLFVRFRICATRSHKELLKGWLLKLLHLPFPQSAHCWDHLLFDPVVLCTEFPVGGNEKVMVAEEEMLETSTVFAPGDGFGDVPRLAETPHGCICDKEDDHEHDVRLSVPSTS